MQVFTLVLQTHAHKTSTGKWHDEIKWLFLVDFHIFVVWSLLALTDLSDSLYERDGQADDDWGESFWAWLVPEEFGREDGEDVDVLELSLLFLNRSLVELLVTKPVDLTDWKEKKRPDIVHWSS